MFTVNDYNYTQVMGEAPNDQYLDRYFNVVDVKDIFCSDCGWESTEGWTTALVQCRICIDKHDAIIHKACNRTYNSTWDKIRTRRG